MSTIDPEIELARAQLAGGDATATLATGDIPPPASLPSSQPSDAGSDAGRSSSGGAPVTTPHEALALAEARRLRMLAGFTCALAVFASAAMLPMSGYRTAQIGHVSALLVLSAVAAWTFWRLRDPSRYRTSIIVVLATGSGGALSTGYVYWGIYSSAVLFLPIALYLFASTRSRAPALALLLFAGVPHAVLGVLTTFGAIEDHGVVRTFVMGTYEQLAVLGLAQFGFVVTFLLARMTRRSLGDAVEELDRAVRGVAKREALLAEAKQELVRALKIGGPGLYTDQVLGSFRLGALIGRGAMGEVYEANHIETSDRAAVKVLSPGTTGGQPAIMRFLREVEIAATLTSPHVVRVLEVPDATAAELPYLAMELLQGKSLSDILRDTTKLRPARVATMIAELSAGIGAAHAAGIVHRDLKPGNVHCDERGDRKIWKVLDFGISKLAGHSGTLTKGQIVGTPSYMAPEQARGDDVDKRADLYALGVIAYRTLTGRPAFSGPDIPSILYGVAHRMPPRPSSMAKLPPEVDQVLAIAMAKASGDRFATAKELSDALTAALRGVISSELASRADTLLAALPWGSRR